MDLSQGSPGKTMSLKSAPKVATLRDRILKISAVQRLIQWIHSMPRPPIAVEISSDRISAVRFSRGGNVMSFAVEPLGEGMVVPSPVDTNIADSAGVRSAMSRLMLAGSGLLWVTRSIMAAISRSPSRLTVSAVT